MQFITLDTRKIYRVNGIQVRYNPRLRTMDRLDGSPYAFVKHKKEGYFATPLVDNGVEYEIK